MGRTEERFPWATILPQPTSIARNQLAASSITIFTFLLFFLYPRFESGEVNLCGFKPR